MRLLVPLILSGCVGLQSGAPVKDAADTSGDSGVVVGELSTDVSAVEFGEVTVGLSVDQTVTVTNTGATVARLAAVLDGDGGFTLSDSSMAVAGGGDSVLTVGFEPGFTGSYAATLTLSPVDGSDAITLPVSGIGVDENGDNGGGDSGDSGDSGSGDSGSGDSGSAGEGSLTVSPGSYDFGQLDLGDDATTTFTLRNDGTSDLLVSDITSSNPAFVHSGGTVTLPQVISAGSSKTAQVTFTPTAERVYSATLTFTTDDSAHPTTTITLAGEGADLCDVCAPLIAVNTGGDPYSVTDFLSILGIADTRSWTIRNEGDMDLTVSDVFVNNDAFAPCGDFTIPPFTATTVSPGASTRFSITYRATEPCIEVPNPSFDMNVVHIYSNDTSQSDYIIELGGLGI